MSLPNDVCRCVNDTCPMNAVCLRWQAFMADRESKEDVSHISYAWFTPEHDCNRDGSLKGIDCEHAIWER